MALADPASPLSRMPPDSLDGEWEASAGSLPGEVRARWLAEADGLREGDLGARRRALAAYRALRGDLDPARAEDAARILWVFENDRRRDAPVGDLAAAASGTEDPEFRDLGRLIGGQVEADSGDAEAAVDLLRALLGDVRGSGRRVERFALLSLAKIYAHQRRGYEALVLARVASGLARKAGHAWDLSVARARTCMALQVLDDGPRLGLAVEELDRALDDIPAERARPLRWMVYAWRAESALDVEDLEGAVAAVEGLRSLAPSPADTPGDPRQVPYLAGQVALLAGKPREALAEVERARALPVLLASSDLPLALLAARARIALGEKETARVRIGEVLDLLLEAPEPDPLGTGQRIKYATACGKILQEACDDSDRAREAFDLAAGLVLQRIVEVHRVMEQVPELAGITQEDLKALTDYRDRFLEEQKELLDRVAALLEGEGGQGLAPPGEDGEEGLFHACAWCRRVRGMTGRWLPIGEFLPEDERLSVSHGICPDCHRRWLERVTRERAG